MADRDGQSVLPNYEYHGARTLVWLHEQQLRSFLKTWQAAKQAAVKLPITTDPAYVSLEALLVHVFKCARRYLVWMCEALHLPDPEIQPVPFAEDVAGAADGYCEHLVRQWRCPLAGVKEEVFCRTEKHSWWNVIYCVDAMLEHAVMHPWRHRFQLEELLAKEQDGASSRQS